MGEAAGSLKDFQERKRGEEGQWRDGIPMKFPMIVPKVP